ncbi:MAG: PepSY-associated TM helix domain-containing protein [Acidobacteriota bacterium]
MFRKILFWMHLAAGLTTGVVILIMSVTGTILMYEKQIVAYADRQEAERWTAGKDASAWPLGIEEIIANARTTSGSLPTSITLRAHNSEPWTIAVSGGGSLLVDGNSGRILGPQAAGTRAFFRTVTDWHRWLGNRDNRATARMITGASNVAFLFLVTSGLYLWFPRKWKWQNVRAVLFFRGGLSGKARDFNWHNVTGFWCCLPLFFVVLSGVVISYPWASNLVYAVNGVQPPAQGKGKAKGGEGKQRPSAVRGEIDLTGINGLVVQAKKQVPEWKSISFSIPASEQRQIVFNVDVGNGGQPQKRSTLTMNRATGEMIRWETFTDQDAGRQARSWLRFVHTGEYYGLAGQTIAGIASAGGAFLVWTGLALAYRRLRAWQSRNRW